MVGFTEKYTPDEGFHGMGWYTINSKKPDKKGHCMNAFTIYLQQLRIELSDNSITSRSLDSDCKVSFTYVVVLIVINRLTQQPNCITTLAWRKTLSYKWC